MPTARTTCLLVVLVAGIPAAGYGKGLSRSAQAEVERRFAAAAEDRNGTFLVVVKEKIPAGLDAVAHESAGFESGGVSIKKNVAEAEVREGKITKFRFRQKEEYYYELGTILLIERLRIRDDRIELEARGLDPPPAAPTVAGGSQPYERTKLKFYFGRSTMDSDDLETVFAAIETWLKPFQAREEALKYSVALVGPRMRYGMPVAELEAMMGPPERKDEQGNKVVYWYENLVVEFVDGRAARYARR